MLSMKTEPELYKPAEACRVAEVAPYVLRYWETEFPALSDGKEKGAARLYTGKDVRIIRRIRELLYDEGFTVAGAKKRLEAEMAEGRFDEGLEAAPPSAQQKKGSVAPPQRVSESGGSFLSETAAPASSKAASRTEFPERQRVLRELKEIAKLIDRDRARPAR